MGFMDTIIGAAIIITFVGIIISRIYNHEKEHIDPVIKKVKGWFIRDEGDDFFDPNEDFELSFKGNPH